MAETHDEMLPPDGDVVVSPGLLHSVEDALESENSSRLASLVADLRPPDFADLIELLEPEQRVQLVEALGHALDPRGALRTRRGRPRPGLRGAAEGRAGQVIGELQTDDAAYVIENLEESDQKEILAQLPGGDRAAVERNLEYPEDTAGR